MCTETTRTQNTLLQILGVCVCVCVCVTKDILHQCVSVNYAVVRLNAPGTYPSLETLAYYSCFNPLPLLFRVFISNGLLTNYIDCLSVIITLKHFRATNHDTHCIFNFAITLTTKVDRFFIVTVALSSSSTIKYVF